LTNSLLFPTQTNTGLIIETKLFDATGGRYPDIGVELRSCGDNRSCPPYIFRIGATRLAFTPSSVAISGGVNIPLPLTANYGLLKFKVDLTIRVGLNVTGPARQQLAFAFEFKAEVRWSSLNRQKTLSETDKPSLLN
jgi:hypothetical protein